MKEQEEVQLTTKVLLSSSDCPTLTVLARIYPTKYRHSTVDILAGYHEPVVQTVPIHGWPQFHRLELEQHLLGGRQQIHYQSAIRFLLNRHGKPGTLKVRDGLGRPPTAG